ncbi:MAG: ABC transporter substrate-binding protein [Thermomicrobiales bacterium]
MSTIGFSRRSFITGTSLGAAAVVGLRAATSLPATAARQDDLELVTLQLNWNPNAEHAPYYLGQKLGFYAEEGIDVEIRPGQGSSTAVKLVGTGDSDFGVAVADAVTVGRGQGVPVVATAVLLQESPTVLVSFVEKGIVEPADLVGKRVAVNTQSTVHAYWLAFLDVNEVDRSQITEVNVSGASLPLLIADQVDATGALLTNEVVTLLDEGFELNIINYGEYGVQSYGQVLFTNDTFATENPDLTGRFTAATLRSWDYSLEHVDEAVAALAEAIPETDVELETAKWTPIQELVLGSEGDIQFGEQTLEGWQETYDTFEAGGLIDEPFDPQSLFTNDFLPAGDEAAATPAA